MRSFTPRLLLPVVLLFVAATPTRAQDVRWEQLPHLSGPDSVFFSRDLTFDGDTLYAASSEGLLRLTPGSTAWEVFLDGEDIDAVAVTVEGYLMADIFGGLLRSMDGGETWEEIPNVGGEHLWRAETGPHTSSLLATSSAMRRSTDGGTTWSYVILPIPEPTSYRDFLALPEGSPGKGALLIACIFGVMRSTDGGASFEETSIYGVNQYSAYSLAALGAGGAVALLGSGAVYRSRDGGQTWTLVGSLDEPAGHLVQAGGAAGGGLYAVGFYSGMTYRSPDEGATWEEAGTVFEGQLRVWEVVAGPDGRLYAAVYRAGPPTAETGVYRTVEPVAVTVNTEENALVGAESFRLGTPYPNPSSGTTTVPLVLAEAAEVRLAVYDVLGREVALLHEGRLRAGAHRFVLDVALPAGPYLVRAEVQAGSLTSVLTQRLTLLR